MERYQLNDVFRRDFAVSDPATGAAVNADESPTIEIYEDGDTTPMHTAAASLRDTGRTGQYTVSVTLSSVDGFEIGKVYNVYVLAEVDEKLGKAVIATFTISRRLTYFA